MELPCRVALATGAACILSPACTDMVQVSDKYLFLWYDLRVNSQGIYLVSIGLRFLLMVSVFLTAEVSH